MIQEKPINDSTQILTNYKSQLQNEWLSILDYWMNYVVDKENGGFYGSVDNMNIPDRDAAKGVVMNCRLLWTFSASFINLKTKKYLEIANRAYNYLIDHFVDHEFGGVYWSVDRQGNMLDGRKQIYGLAFCMYGISEYYKATKSEQALQFCKQLFDDIEKRSFDEVHGGYLEAFARDWKPVDDLRLSEKDDNEKKTMNTHLHVIEAYANLYEAWPDEKLKNRIVGLLDNFDRHFINKETFHLNLFMDEQWHGRSSLVSFGHDIEAAWLLLSCAETIRHEKYIELYKNYAIEIGYAATEGLDNDGGLWYEYEPLDDMLNEEKHSWPQAEAMIGFLNVYQLTGNRKYLTHSLNSWDFTRNYIIDKKMGEWFWGVDANNNVMDEKDKAGFWKCSYHNSRACMQVINRIDRLLNKKV
jgi:mannobiose 2-epimerase